MLVTLWVMTLLAVFAGSAVVAHMAFRVIHPGSDDPHVVDAVVVLSGEQRRIERGLALLGVGWAPRLVVSRGERWGTVAPYCGAGELSPIWCPEPEVNSTRGEAQMIARLVAENGWTSLIIVTNAYHAARARMLVERCLDDSVDVRWVLAKSARPSPGLLRSEVVKRLYSAVLERSC